MSLPKLHLMVLLASISEGETIQELQVNGNWIDCTETRAFFILSRNEMFKLRVKPTFEESEVITEVELILEEGYVRVSNSEKVNIKLLFIDGELKSAKVL